MQRQSKVIPWRPRGLSDTLDASNTFAGAMSSLQNLIPDPTTRGLWQCRPASLKIALFPPASGDFNATDFSPLDFSTSLVPYGLISALKVIGNFAYGMVASGAFSGHDEAFCYNLSTGAFVTITGMTNTNLPTSPATTGTWTPPTMSLIGAKLVVTHPGFTGASNAWFGVLDITNPAAPTWTAQNLTGAITFTTPPSAVAQFNSRAYWITNAPAQPAVIFSDSLNPTNCTNSTQILTFGDNVPLTALGGLPLSNQLGGIIQSLMVFKGVQNIYQITGDAAATGGLQLNTLNIATGTLAPNTVVSTPKGLAFVAPDGVRLIDFFGRVSDPIGLDGMGVTVPFLFAVTPSRMCAACNGDVLRVSVQNGNASGSPNQEYWYDLARQIWSGPHTFPFSQIQPYAGTFIGAPIGVTASLWQSDPVQSITSTFVENSVQLSWVASTPLLPITDQMVNKAMTEAIWFLGLSASFPVVTISALDENASVLNSVTVNASGTATIWGSFVWGAALWGGQNNAMAPRQLQWTEVIVFTRLQIQASGTSAQGVKIGTLQFRWQILRYLSSIAAA